MARKVLNTWACHLTLRKKKKRYSGTEESIIFAGADPSVDQGTEKNSLFPLRLQRDSSSYLALLLVL